MKGTENNVKNLRKEALYTYE